MSGQVGSIIPGPGDPVTATDIEGLQFLASYGPHQIGLIDDDDKLCAAIVFEGLKNRGFVLASLDTGGPTYRITPKGRTILPLEAA